MLCSCASNKKKSIKNGIPDNCFEDGSPIVNADTCFDGRDTVLFTFGGDIMSHRPNFSMKEYDSIYNDISPFLKESDLAFANLESPVDDLLPYSSYPNFNIHHGYPDAAIQAGFNVFSLANNHANDQKLDGIKGTVHYFKNKMADTASTARPVYACGLKTNANDPLTYQLIDVKGWKILFVAITEILNRNDYASYIDLFRPNQKQRALLIQKIKTLREMNPCDLFILSIHCSDPEYVTSIAESQREFYLTLLNNGVDVVWANHPHVAKSWEAVGSKQNGKVSKIIFFALGNTISGQRWQPSFSEPEAAHDSTGDGYLVQVRFEKDKNGIHIVWINPVLITTYITPSYGFVIKKLDDSFINSLEQSDQKKWSHYLNDRKILMENTKGTTLWQ